MDELARAGRNLNIISGAIIVYLFAGADVNELSVLGARMPLGYPIVLEIAGVVLFAWFLYLFNVHVPKPIRNTLRNGFYAELRTNRTFTNWWKSRPVTEGDLAQATRQLADQRGISGDKATAVWVYDPLADAGIYRGIPWLSRNGVISMNYRRINYSISKGTQGDFNVTSGVPDDHRLPFVLQVRVRVGSAWSYLRTKSDIAHIVVPYVMAFTALALIVLDFGGLHPAGFFGLLPNPRAMREPSIPFPVD